jgi:predicted metalloprotease with PDZ domain
VGGDRNTTISYYNNGAMLGAMLDLKIREGSKNQRSLDDVMRGLYQKYYEQKTRGFRVRSSGQSARVPQVPISMSCLTMLPPQKK